MSDIDVDSSSLGIDLNDEDDMKDTLRAEGEMSLKKPIELGKGLNWQLEFPDLNLQSNVDIDPLEHLLEANMGTLMQKSLHQNQR